MPRALSIACLIGVVAVGSAVAQPPGRAGKVMHFRKPVEATAPVSGGGGQHLAQLPIPAPPTDARLPMIPSPSTALPQVPPVPGGGQKDKPKQQTPETSPEQIAKYTKLETRERIFSMPDDATLQRYIRMRHLEDNPNAKPDDKSLRFPPTPPVGGGKTYVAKTASYPPMQAHYASLYVVHRRLHFEDVNTERYGWDMGIVQPFFSTVNFYKDVFLWPQSLASGCAYGFWDTNAGKCLPGSPTPYYLYPPGLTITGSVFESVIITGAAFAIP